MIYNKMLLYNEGSNIRSGKNSVLYYMIVMLHHWYHNHYISFYTTGSIITVYYYHISHIFTLFYFYISNPREVHCVPKYGIPHIILYAISNSFFFLTFLPLPVQIHHINFQIRFILNTMYPVANPELLVNEDEARLFTWKLLLYQCHKVFL